MFRMKVSQVLNFTITHKTLCLFHVSCFMFQQFSIILYFINCAIPDTSISNNTLIRYYWNISVLKYVRLYLCIKSILKGDIYSYLISLGLIINNFVISIIAYFSCYCFNDIFVTFFFEIPYALSILTEVILSCVYLYIKRVELITEKFKKTGHNPSFIKLYNSNQIIKSILVIDFINSSAHMVFNIYELIFRMKIFSTIEFFASSLIILLVNINHEFYNKSLNKFIEKAMILSLIYYLGSFVLYIILDDLFTSLFHHTQGVSRYLLKTIIYSVLVYNIRINNRFYISYDELKYMMKHKKIFLK